MSELIACLRRLQRDGALDLPLPGAGATADRHLALMSFGRSDLSVARLAEAHTDAIAILAECGRRPAIKGIYGVWASDGPQSQLTATRNGPGWCLAGTKQFCSGAGIIDAALVTAHSEAGRLMFELALESSHIKALPSTWVSPALADTATGAVQFEQLQVPDTCLIGEPGRYLERPGFWHGAIGPAACWAGGAVSLAEAAAALDRRDPHSLAQRGALTALSWGLQAILVTAAHEIDAEPANSTHARQRALKVRHLIERWCAETLDRFGQATGPMLLTQNTHAVRQHMALSVYIRQCHGAKDLEALAL